jgi:hypothetical protein
MKKMILSVLFSFAISVNYGQYLLPDSYKNLEKYWFYRYRLVNDFLKVSDEPGGSIPARERRRKNPSGVSVSHDNPENGLKWADATIDLGHYIGTLATEYRQLSDQMWSTKRTEQELHYAIRAFERLEEYAEPYCYMVSGNYQPGYGYPGLLTQSTINQFYQRKNGFFIRDDVPFLNFVEDNDKHFNRPAMNNAINRVNEVTSSAFSGRYQGPNPYNNKSVPPLDADYQKAKHPPVPVYPTEESQDQLADIFIGMSLVNNFVSNTNYNFQQRAQAQIYNTIDWISQDLHWQIKNPLTFDCVYGIAPDNYPNSCMDAGGMFVASARPASAAVKQLVGSSANTMYTLGLLQENLFQQLQFMNCDPVPGQGGTVWVNNTKDIAFTDGYAAISRTWKLPYLPWPFNNLVNTTWHTVRDHSMSNFFGTPHLPLVYKWFHQFNGVDFSPENHTATYTGWQLPSYNELLNSAPDCGPYNYNYTNNYANKEWSGSNRLSEPYFRKDIFPFCTDVNGKGYVNSDYNGLDYMLLFNLYAHVQKNYLNVMINPYYTENLSVNYPDMNGLGSFGKRLRLNYLEYLSAINKINDEGYVTYRGGKVIDLNPGFEAKYGCRFLARIADYYCDDGPYHYAYEQEVNEVFQDERPIVYTPSYASYTESGVPIPEDSTYYEDDLIDQYLTPEIDSIMMDSLKRAILEGGDSMAIYMYRYYTATTGNDTSGFGGKGGSTGNSNPKNPKAGTAKIQYSSNGWISVYPNPNDGTFTLELSQAGDYELRVLNVVGSVVYSDKISNERKRVIQLDARLPAGTYVVQLTGKDVRYIEKITVVK